MNTYETETSIVPVDGLGMTGMGEDVSGKLVGEDEVWEESIEMVSKWPGRLPASLCGERGQLPHTTYRHEHKKNWPIA